MDVFAESTYDDAHLYPTAAKSQQVAMLSNAAPSAGSAPALPRSSRQLARFTGLARSKVVPAIASLAARGLIHITPGTALICLLHAPGTES
jgi:DNA-binding transcriptional MocR family regulator